MSYQYLKVTVEEGIGTITISNPPANVLSTTVMREMQSVLNSMKEDSNVRVIILTGEGVMFAAGADIKELQALKSKEEAYELSHKVEGVLKEIENFPKPIICAINGFCYGGGNELAMCCHIRIASEKARFAQPEINLGITPGMGGTQRLPRLIPKGKAFEMLLTGEPISAQEAKAYGLVNAVVPHNMLLNHATGIAKKIAQKSLATIRLIIEAVNKGSEMNINEAVDFESEIFSRSRELEDSQEGLSAFLEKRQTKFKDR